MSAAPGRTCPLHYRYAPEAIAAAPTMECDTLYVVGGLYGNEAALAEIGAMAAAEPGGATLVFNGDHNWFDVDAGSYRRVNEAVLRHAALCGNVETELASPHAEAGCGCGYPPWVSDAEVARSNDIMERLRATAVACPDVTERLAALPRYAAVRVGGVRIAIVHGDAESLAGWSYAQELLGDPVHRRRVAAHFERCGASIIASSHTCLPVAAAFETPSGRRLLFNNGAAGMPNFRRERHGVITRVALTPAREPLYEARLDQVHVAALAVRYDHETWLDAFLSNWPPGTSAHQSYFHRISYGPDHSVQQAWGTRWPSRSTEPPRGGA